jgi:RNA-directed DNA polymerase
MGRSHLELNMDKTQLLEFGRIAHQDRQARGGSALPTFDFLGFTHYCSNTRGGRFVVKRKTSGKKMQAKLKELRKELRVRLHDPVKQVGEWLGSVLKGHYQYYAVPHNIAMLGKFRSHILRRWKRTLSRRSQKAYCDWEQANYLAALPEVGARCGKSARRDLCGGLDVTLVPTAIVSLRIA